MSAPAANAFSEPVSTTAAIAGSASKPAMAWLSSPDQLLVQGVQLLGAVQRDDRDGVTLFDQDGLESHCSTPLDDWAGGRNVERSSGRTREHTTDAWFNTRSPLRVQGKTAHPAAMQHGRGGNRTGRCCPLGPSQLHDDSALAAAALKGRPAGLDQPANEIAAARAGQPGPIVDAGTSAGSCRARRLIARSRARTTRRRRWPPGAPRGSPGPACAPARDPPWRRAGAATGGRGTGFRSRRYCRRRRRAAGP